MNGREHSERKGPEVGMIECAEEKEKDQEGWNVLNKKNSVMWLSSLSFLPQLSDSLFSAVGHDFTEFKEMVWKGSILRCHPWESGGGESHRQEN